jgi:hypothetical protein
MTNSLLGAFWADLATRRAEVDRGEGLEGVMSNILHRRRLFRSAWVREAAGKIAQFVADLSTLRRRDDFSRL